MTRGTRPAIDWIEVQFVYEGSSDLPERVSSVFDERSENLNGRPLPGYEGARGTNGEFDSTEFLPEAYATRGSTEFELDWGGFEGGENSTALAGAVIRFSSN